MTPPGPNAESESVTGWRLGQIETALAAILGKLDDRPAWKDVRTIEDGLLERVRRLEEWQTWALRLGAPSIIGAFVGMLFNAFRLTG